MPGLSVRTCGAGVALGAVLLYSAAPAHAQVSGALSVDSEFRLRGLTLADRKAALSVTGGIEQANGLYAGGLVVVGDAPGGPIKILGHVEQLGYAFRDVRGVSWDVGVSNTDVTLQRTRQVNLAYTEVYFGVSRRDLSARLYISPNYQGGVTTAYLDLNATRRLANDWRASAHLGVLRRLSAATARVTFRERSDLRLGLARELGRAEVRLDWFATRSSPSLGPSLRQSGLVAGASLFF